MIKGIPIILHVKEASGTDAFNRTTYTDSTVTVENVLVAPLSDQEILDSLNLTGRKATYQLGIPKGDNHEWENCVVEFFGEKWRVIGHPTEGIDSMVPLKWNKKVKVESIVGESQNSTA